MRALFYFVLVLLTAGCREKQSSGGVASSSQDWEPKGYFDPSEVIRSPACNHVFLFETGRVTHFFPGGKVGMGLYEKTNGVWIWHLFANHWKIEPDGSSLLFTELGDPKNPLLRNPTNKFHLMRLTPIPDNRSSRE